ncbi:MAG: DsbA family oxidoreductase [Elusimicrobiota bacterium]
MKVRIDVFSDVVCPWCYVGKKRMERAAAELAGRHELEVAWHPFELNPGMPAGGLPRREYLSKKFGGLEELERMDARMKEVGEGEGISFRQEAIERAPNTFDAHRLIWLAGRRGRQDAVVEGLFHSYFSQGRDVGDRSVLARIAGECGLDPAAAAAFLAGEEGRAEVRLEEEEVRRAGLRAVPFFIIGGETALEGAEPPETFLQAVESLTVPRHSP